MKSKSSPAFVMRQRLEKLLINKGHKFAVFDKEGELVVSARFKSNLEKMFPYRKNLKIVEIEDEIEKLSF